MREEEVEKQVEAGRNQRVDRKNEKRRKKIEKTDTTHVVDGRAVDVEVAVSCRVSGDGLFGV